MNAYINTPVVVDADRAVPFGGLNSASRGCWAINGGWLYAPANSGIFTLRKPGRYLVQLTAQLTGIAGVAELTLQTNGVDYPGTQMAETIAAATDFATVGTAAEILVTNDAPVTVSVINSGDAAVTINNASLVINRLS